MNRNRIIMIVSGVLLTTLLAGALLLGYVVYWPLEPDSSDNSVDVLVHWGTSFYEVARMLEAEHVVRDATQFILTAKLLNKTQHLRAGKYSFQTGMSNYTALKSLIQSRQSFFKVTLPEGYDSRRFASILQREINIDSSAFVTLVNDSAFIASLDVKAASLEGYLYPETYFFTYGVNEHQIISALVDQFWATVPDSLIEDATEKGLTLNEVLTLASIIEGEAMLDEEMTVISSVYHNRLELGMLLQADPTIQYIIPDGPRRLLNRDLEIDSPYNTYKYAGLPPGPISNPGISAIRAAVYPADTRYLYFVANGDGSHTFSRTLRDHLNAKARFDKIRRKVAREKRKQLQDGAK